MIIMRIRCIDGLSEKKMRIILYRTTLCPRGGNKTGSRLIHTVESVYYVQCTRMSNNTIIIIINDNN